MSTASRLLKRLADTASALRETAQQVATTAVTKVSERMLPYAVTAASSTMRIANTISQLSLDAKKTFAAGFLFYGMPVVQAIRAPDIYNFFRQSPYSFAIRISCDSYVFNCKSSPMASFVKGIVNGTCGVTPVDCLPMPLIDQSTHANLCDTTFWCPSIGAVAYPVKDPNTWDISQSTAVACLRELAKESCNQYEKDCGNPSKNTFIVAATLLPVIAIGIVCLMPSVRERARKAARSCADSISHCSRRIWADRSSDAHAVALEETTTADYHPAPLPSP